MPSVILFVCADVTGLTVDAGTKNGVSAMLIFVNMYSTGAFIMYFPFDSIRMLR